MTQQPPELRHPTQGDFLYNGITHPVYGLGKRTGTDHIRKIPGLGGNANLWSAWISRDTFEQYVVLYDGHTLRVLGLNGYEYPVVVAAGSLEYLRTSTPRKDVVSLTLADTTLVLNRTKVVSMTSATTPAALNKAVVWIKQGNYGQEYRVKLAGTDYAITADSADPTLIQTSQLASDLAASIGTGPGGAYTTTYTAGDSYMVIHKTAGGTFTIEGRDSMNGAGLGVVMDNADGFTDLPPFGPDGMVVRVLGSPEDSADDYWVRFDASREDPSHWGEAGRVGRDRGPSRSHTPSTRHHHAPSSGPAAGRC
jgi:hypothetical protein